MWTWNLPSPGVGAVALKLNLELISSLVTGKPQTVHSAPTPGPPTVRSCVPQPEAGLVEEEDSAVGHLNLMLYVVLVGRLVARVANLPGAVAGPHSAGAFLRQDPGPHLLADDSTHNHHPAAALASPASGGGKYIPTRHTRASTWPLLRGRPFSRRAHLVCRRAGKGNAPCPGVRNAAWC